MLYFPSSVTATVPNEAGRIIGPRSENTCGQGKGLERADLLVCGV